MAQNKIIVFYYTVGHFLFKKWTGLLPALLCLFCVFFFLSCSFNLNKYPNVIVIAVDGLGVNQVQCLDESREEGSSGFDELCKKSLRFTHAYTTSLQTIPAVGSILTGLLPIESQYPANHRRFISSTEQTLPELLFQKKIATSFFSGGTPVIRKSNLHQGFDLFDDFFKPHLGKINKSFSQLGNQFFSWQKEIHRRPFLSFIYVNDLMFIDTPTTDSSGRARDLSYDSQVAELDESLGVFFKRLQQQDLWDNTTLILVGLNGPIQGSRPSELFETNLYSERTQISLLIKPAQKPKDTNTSWTVNENVSLADVGQTLAEMYEETGLKKSQVALSLFNKIKNPLSPLPEERPILTEAFWNQTETPRFSIRIGAYLAILDQKLKIYNSFLDKNESSPIPSQDINKLPIFSEVESFTQNLKLTNWLPVDFELENKWKYLNQIFTEKTIAAEDEESTLQKAAHRFYKDPLFQKIYTTFLLKHEDWIGLQKWSIGIEDSDLQKLSQINLKPNTPAVFQSPCLMALQALDKYGEISRKCDEKLAFQFLEWLQSELTETTSNSNKETLKNKFIRNLFVTELDNKVSELNFIRQGAFDYGFNPDHQRLTIDMMLNFSKARKFKPIIEKELSNLQELYAKSSSSN